MQHNIFGFVAADFLPHREHNISVIFCMSPVVGPQQIPHLYYFVFSCAKDILWLRSRIHIRLYFDVEQDCSGPFL